MLDNSNVTKKMIYENYYRIKNDIIQMVESEIQKLLETLPKETENQEPKIKNKKTKSSRNTG
jgi:hypothetical protein